MSANPARVAFTIDGDLVTKSYASWDRGEPRREWDLLTLLDIYAPGLAATPVRAAR